MCILVAKRTPRIAQVHILDLRITADDRRLFVAGVARQSTVSACQPISGAVVVKGGQFAPRILAMTFGTDSGPKLLAMWIDGGVTIETCGSQPQKRLVERPVFSFEGSHVRCSYQTALVTVTAIERVMSIDQIEAHARMLESRGVEPDQLEVLTEVVFVTVRTLLLGYGCVKASPLGHPVANWRVAIEAKLVGNSSLAEDMTVGAVT